MTRNLKTLGLALAAMLALGAVAASAASAQEQGFLTSDGPVTLDIDEVGTDNALHAFGSVTKCPGSTFTGHKYTEEKETTQEEKELEKHTVLIPNGETTTTITPHYNQTACRATTGGTERTATVDMNGCDFVFHIGKTTPAENNEGTYGVTADVVCPAGNKIHVTVWAVGAPHTNNPICTTEVGSQSGLEGAHVTDEGNGHLRVKGTFTGITVTRHLVCQFFQPTTDHNGTFVIDATVRGTDALGGDTEISLSH